MTPDTQVWHVWRHPKPIGAEGRCIGRTDLPVDRRKAKRLARRIQRFARLHGLPRAVITSPLARCADVGHWLVRWGWQHRIDGELRELDFGRWDGLSWQEVARAEVDAWCADFAGYAPGGGESLADLLARARRWMPQAGESIVVGHAGWMQALRWWRHAADAQPDAATWPAPPRHGERLTARLGGAFGT